MKRGGGLRKGAFGRVAVGLCCLAVCVAPLFVARAADAWPQWGGVHRDFKSEVKGLARVWPAGGPRKVWERALGEGHSSIISDGARLYTMYRKGASEYVVALDAASGRTVWQHEEAAPLLAKMDMSYGAGPHSTPLIAGELVCAVGTTAKLLCLNRADGRKVWGHDLWSEFGGSRINVGYSSSPVAYKDAIIVQVGGAGHSLMSFSRRDGSVRWQAHDFRNSSSSPIIIDVDGQTQLVAFMHNEVVGLNPEDGRLLWRHAVSAEWNFHFNISTPVWGEGNLLFVAAAYGMGGRVLQLARAGDGKTAVRELWQSERTRVHKENAIRLGDVVYASTGHLGPAFFTAIDVKTGRVLWQERGFSHASFLYADGKFIILDEDGTLALATPTANGLDVHARVELFDGTSWTVPTLVGTTLYLRDRKTIMALKLG
ncbi:MAG TPA: PQQ-binding-like beta-propeller repeat protein [Pyrinomonadaceae bacterium]